MAHIKLRINESAFIPAFFPYVQDYSYRYNVFYGGRGSGKTNFLFQKLIIKGLSEKRNILLMRKTTVSCKSSVWAELKKAVTNMQLNKYFKFYESDYSAICHLTGTTFKCLGLDDPEKIKGFSEISDVLLEEATEFTVDDFELIDGTVRSILYVLPLQIYLSFNPVSKANWVYKYFGFDTGIVPPNTFISKTTYLDNPFVSDDYVKRMENMKLTNPTRWRIEALGDFVSLDKLVFPVFETREFDHAEIKGQLCIGLDFGFVNDVSALVASILDEENKTLYIFKEWGETGKTNDQLAAIISSLGFSKSTIIADAAEMKSIEEISRKGITRIKACVKGPDSIIHGIQKMQQYKIVVHPSCEEVITELENYAWQKDKKTNEYINKPIDQFNHYIDAIRYSLQCVDNTRKLKTMSKSSFARGL